ncbi:hypothetical protein HXX02_07470 [Microbulbifer elongatus]|uniref:Lipoprotein n=1 Tax=Microbulbifer elongatus TaxID=86173 RepID=A0ABT1NZL9_9GAMM|nr:hypothetical protein [Microbulbifer elongatus]MCQ3829281.1 hypothetical protein [Microbulbifer elongatus]
MFTVKPKFPSLCRGLALATSALLLAACEGDISDDIAQEDSLEIRLQQCEVGVGGVVGTPTEPVVIDGVETQACLLNTDAGQQVDVRLKSSHNFEPLVWVLDGTYEIGESKSYATLAELQADTLHYVGNASKVYAMPGTVVVVHRNGSFAPDIESIDDNNTGGGEWGGVVVNGIGYHPDCGTTGGADNFCNVQGEWGYYGGLSLQEARESVMARGTGFDGYVAEAGGELSGGGRLSAAITLNAPHFVQTSAPQGVFYSATNGLELNGGALDINRLRALGNQGHALYWHSGFGGEVVNSIIHHQSDLAAVKGENSGSGDSGVSISGLTLVDQSLNAGAALVLAGGGKIGIDNMVVQGFGACLDIADGNTGVAITNSAFYCSETTAAAEDGSDYAAQALANAENFYTLNPDLTNRLEIDNTEISGINAALLSGSTQVYGYELGLVYAPCYGAGALLEETVSIGTSNYRVCELTGEITDNLYFDNDINGELVLWRLSGNVTLGTGFSGLDAAQQQALLARPQKVILDHTSVVQVATGATLTVNPGVALTIAGTAADPIELKALDAQAGWGGITINGLADSCSSAELCALAQQQFVEIDYLRVLNAGNGQPALTLNEVSAAGQINYLDIADSASTGLSLNGGAVNIDNLLVSDVVGNQVQWATGYRGSLQYAILQSGAESVGHALHGRNNADDHDAAPRSRPVMANITVKGAEQADTAILLEQGSGLLLYNSVVADFNTCLDIDDPATASLQTSDPAEIFFDNVVLDCEATIAEEDEEAGMDYAASTQGLSGVYQVSAVLDSNFVPSGSDIPGIESSIDFTLAGAVANYLNANVNFMGSVRDSIDDWYLGWSDSVGVLLAAECDFKAVLEDDYRYTGRAIIVRDENGVAWGESYYPQYKVCGLRGTITEDFLLNAYTGADRLAVENGEQVVDMVKRTVFVDGEFVERELSVAYDPLPTLWLINGLVRIGEGHLELSDPAQVAAMKADPVTLGIEASSVVMVSEGGGLHITRGGELVVLGGESLLNGDTDASGPVNLVGLLNTSPTHVSGEPMNARVRNWVGLIVDGFARNNQCPDAAITEPGSRVCNIQGEYGFHGGYDNDHGNLWVENLHMLKGSLRLNSVGRGGKVENFYFGLGDQPGSGPAAWGEDNFRRAAIDIDGGVVNLRNINLASAVPGNNIRWNHGFQGSMQSVNIAGHAFAGDSWGSVEDFVSPLYQVDGVWHADPAILGRNGDPGREDDLPRSMPTLANVTLFGSDAVDAFNPALPPVTSNLIELAQGSGLYLYNSTVGASKFDLDSELWFGVSYEIDQCITMDASSAALLGENVVFNQVAFACKQMSNDLNLAMQIDNTFASRTFVNVAGTVSNKSTLSNPSLADAEIYYFDWVTGGSSIGNYDKQVDGLDVFTQWENMYFSTPDVINLGKVSMNASASQALSGEFIVETDYFGSQDYFLPINADVQIDADF